MEKQIEKRKTAVFFAGTGKKNCGFLYTMSFSFDAGGIKDPERIKTDQNLTARLRKLPQQEQQGPL